ncbi:MAG: hypothetical protein FWH28_06860 [Clostridiales bacterium]|nr:hypothetical protein [Clostridiales bacterium]
MKKRKLKLTSIKKRVFGMPHSLWILIQWFLILSGVTMTMTTTLRGSAAEGIACVLLSLVVYIWLAFRKELLERIVSDFSIPCGLIALAFAIDAAGKFMDFFYFRFDKLAQMLSAFLSDGLSMDAEAIIAFIGLAKVVISCITGMVLCFAAYLLCDWVRRFVLPIIRGLTGMEIAYWASTVVLSIVFIFFVYHYTDLFYYPSVDGQVVLYDAVFSTETGVLMQTDVFVNINATENDLFRPLFGLYSMPFGIAASWIASLFGGELTAYALALAGMQVAALSFSIILLSRLLELRDIDQFCFLMLYFISYPALLFVLNIEHLVFGQFWLSLYLYSICRKEPDQEAWTEVSFSAAAGTSLGSGFFLLFSLEKGGLKHNGRILYRSMLTFLAFMISFGQLPILTSAGEALKALFLSAGTDIPWQDKLWRYLAFIHNCLLSPAVETVSAYAYTSYQQQYAAGPDRIGILLLAFALLGFIVNRRKKYSLICLSWLLLSFLLLGLTGWNAQDSNTILYSFSFSWALLSLLYMGFSRVLAKWPLLRLLIATAAFFVMAAINIKGIRELILFGATHYPR